MIERKVLAGFLSIVMLLTLLPVQVFAEVSQTDSSTTADRIACTWANNFYNILYQDFIKSSGEFIEPTFEVASNVPVDESAYTLSYRAVIWNADFTEAVKECEGSYEAIKAWVQMLESGTQVKLTWTLTSDLYSYTPTKDDFIWLTIQSVEYRFKGQIITNQQDAMDAGAITLKADATYGDSWVNLYGNDKNGIFGINLGLQCYIGNSEFPTEGTFVVDGGENPPQAGTVNATLYFETSPGTRYKVMDLTTTVAPAELTVTWNNTENRVYGDDIEVDYTVSGWKYEDEYAFGDGIKFEETGLDATTAGNHTATLTITGTENYVFDSTGTKTTSTDYTIAPMAITDTKEINVTRITEYYYTGQPIVPSSDDFRITIDGASVETDEYEISFPDGTDHTNVGDAIPVMITFNKNYSGTYEAPIFEISQRELDKSDVAISGIADSYEYTGQAIHPEVIITYDGKQLKKGEDYTITYGANKDVDYEGDNTTEITDEGKIYITFIKNYKGTITETFDIHSAKASGTILLTTADGEFVAGRDVTASLAPGSHVSTPPGYNEGYYLYTWYSIDEETGVANPVGRISNTYQIQSTDTQIYVELTSKGNYEGTIKSGIIVVGTLPLPDDVVSVQKDDTSATEAVAGDVLTANIGDDLTINTDYTLQWYRDGVEITGATGATYTVTAADKGTTLSVAVIGKGGYSGVAVSAAITVPATAPSTPTVTATADDAKVTISWSVSDDGGSDITGYQVSCDNTNWTSLEPSQTEYTFTGLTNDTAYTFLVKAINSVGTSDAGTATATPVKPEEPTDPGDGGSTGGGTTGGGSTGGGSVGGGSTGGSTVEKPVTSGNTTTLTTEVKPTISGDTAKAEISSASMNQKVEILLDAAKNTSTVPSLVFDVVISNTNVDGIELTLPSSSLKELGYADGSLTISSSLGSITLDDTSLVSIGEQSGLKTTIRLEAADKSTLTDKQLKKIGDRPVYELSIISDGKAITNFGGGKAEVTLPYELKDGENPNRIVVYYVDEEGNLTKCSTKYDAATKTVTFETTHFSLYMIGIEQESPFVDVDENGWAYPYILDLYEKGVIGGIGEGQFAPERSITRAEFVKILCGVAGGDATAATATGFIDVAADAWYAPFVAWAVEYGVTTGTSPETFSPDASMTRQEMAAMIYRYADMTGVILPETEAPVTFTDRGSFASWAADAISAMQMAGIIEGVGDGSFNPTGNATRQETCKMLSILMEIVLQ